MAEEYGREAEGISRDAQRERTGGDRDFDLLDRIDAPARREMDDREARRRSPAAMRTNLRMVCAWREHEPTDDDLERYVRWHAEDYAKRAKRLREELGPSFLNGDWQKRDELVRLWRHRYRESGLFPAHR